jgi:hypothetical protein
MNPDLLERQLAELSDKAYTEVEAPTDLGRRVLRVHRRRQRIQLGAAAISVVVLTVAIPLGIHAFGGHATVSADKGKLRQGPPTSTARRSGNQLIYSTGATIQITHDGITTWNSPKLPASDGVPGSITTGGHWAPVPSAHITFQARPVVTRDFTWIRVRFRVSNLTGTARFIIGAVNSRLLAGQGAVAGRFIAVGGPPGAKPSPQHGAVYLQAADQTGVNVVVGANGRFHITAPASTYSLSGRTPQFSVSTGEGPSSKAASTCHALHPIQLRSGRTTHADVYCQRR